MKHILERERRTPIKYKADVVVAGGGPAGLGTALAAARNGAKTILIERYGCLGGLGTVGLVITIPPTPTGHTGILKEIIDELFELGGAYRFKKGEKSAGVVLLDPERFKLLADGLVEKAGTKLLLNSLVVDVVKDGKALRGVIVENKSGRQAVLGKVVIDATGDGDVAAAAGAPYEMEKRKIIPSTLMYIVGGVDNDEVREYQRKDPGLRKAAKKAGFTYCGYQMLREEHRGPNFSHMDRLTKGQVVVWSGSLRADCTDVEELTGAEVELRKKAFGELEFLRKHVPGFENSYLATTATYMGVRETRRIAGEHVLKNGDLSKEFPDVVAQAFSTEPRRRYGVPYRCLLPKRVDNLLVAGRCFSATHEIQNRLREIPACVAMGQAAGTAAALALEQGVEPKELDAGLLQKTLVKQGALKKT